MKVEAKTLAGFCLVNQGVMLEYSKNIHGEKVFTFTRGNDQIQINVLFEKTVAQFDYTVSDSRLSNSGVFCIPVRMTHGVITLLVNDFFNTMDAYA